MFEYGPQHPLSYRQDVLRPLFERIRAGESCAVVAPASMGKTRLLDFMMRPDVQEHYLANQSDETLILRADCNRIDQLSEWGLYELLLTAIVEGSDQRQRAIPHRAEINTWRETVILNKEHNLLALRMLELAARVLITDGMKLCFVLDEFDEAYRRLPAQAMAKLRALRDQNKNRLCYVLMMRNVPEKVRRRSDCESFYELFSRYVIGLGPYREEDMARIVTQLEERRKHTLGAPLKSALLRLSGGHAGTAYALMDIFSQHPEWGLDEAYLPQLASQPAIVEECRKLWESLPEDERRGLLAIQSGSPIPDYIAARLALKGLMSTTSGTAKITLPMLAHYVQQLGPSAGECIWLDEDAHTIQIGERKVTDLSALEFKLAAYFYERLGQVCHKDEIQVYLYADAPSPAAGDDKHVEALVRQLREAIEPDPSHPRYLVAVRDVGYKLNAQPEA